MFDKKNLFSAVIAGVLFLPLCAQLNPKWQTSSSPDFLDLYQQSNSKSTKPEIVTVFDFSGSMDCIVYHKNYPAPSSDDFGNDDQIYFSRRSTNVGGTTYYYPRAQLAITDSGGTRITRTSYTFVRPDGTVLIGDPTAPATAPSTAATLTAARTLIRQTNNTISTPWGTVALLSAFNGPDNQERDIRNWVRAASHVRFRVNDRNIDIPINWTILDTTSTGYPLSPAYGNDTSTTPETHYPLDSIYTFGYGGFDTDSSTDVSIQLGASANGRQSMRYRRAYLRWVFNGNIPPSNVSPAFANGMPSMNRVQAVKLAAIRAWLKNQKKILFAYRFLSNDTHGESDRNFVNSNSRTNPWNSNDPYFCDVPWDTSCGSGTMGGKDRTWTVMNQNTSGGIRRLAATCSTSSTPLTLALANTYAQMNDTNNIFSDVAIDYNTVPEGDPAYDQQLDFRPKECMRHFVILFTDGNPNSEPTTTDASPYESGGVGSALLGNTYFAASSAIRDTADSYNGRAYWSIPNLAAMAAHLNDSSQGAYMNPPASYPANTDIGQSVKSFFPFAIKNRGSVTLQGQYAAIQTMTFGVSLGGTFTSGSKGRLFKAAAMGDPTIKTWDIKTLRPFELTDPNDPTSPAVTGSIYFFDGNDPKSIEYGLDRAFKDAAGMTGTNSTSTPVMPTSGTGLGQAIYLTKFVPPEEGGPIWPGDLMMYPIRENAQGLTQTLDASGNVLSGSNLADPDNARWAASKILASKLWFNRTIYTRMPSSSGTAHPPMLKVTVGSSDTAASISDAGYASIKPLLPGPDDATKFDNWRYFVGASMPVTATPPSTRSTIMGDVVSSSPAVLEFSTKPTTVTSNILNTAWSNAALANKRFRMIFVGTNQGFLHAFGEVSWDTTVTNGSGDTFKIQNGVADELWAFAPTDLLPFIDHYRTSGTHRFGVDGSPTVYLLDIASSTAVRGDGVFNVSSTKERAMVIFGLGKGGRSYYALDVRDPVAPAFKEVANATYGAGMGWSLCPDETNNYPASRFQAPASSSSSSVITNMGLSTSVPNLVRTVATPTKVIKDLVFLGGGFSITEIEGNLPLSSAPGATAPFKDTRLGRSVIALDANGGNILGVWALPSSTSIGPVSSGVMPHTFFSGSGFHQRAYFADYFGGIWALGYGGLDASNIRMDSSYLDSWSASPRPVYKQAATNGLISTVPISFAVPNMPTRTDNPKIAPAAVGLAFVTGDRNNPVDKYYTSSWTQPTQHRVNVIFDRQDSHLLGLDTNGISTSDLANATGYTASSDETDPSDSSFYLKSKYGYYINFPDKTTTLNQQWTPKGMFSPLVLGGRLFFSYYKPTLAEACQPAFGETHTFRVMNIMRPDATATDAVDKDDSGKILVWSGLSSPFAIRSLVSGVQSGMSGGSGTNNNPGNTQNLQMQTLATGSSDIYPKPRIWRTVY